MKGAEPCKGAPLALTGLALQERGRLESVKLDSGIADGEGERGYFEDGCGERAAREVHAVPPEHSRWKAYVEAPDEQEVAYDCMHACACCQNRHSTQLTHRCKGCASSRRGRRPALCDLPSGKAEACSRSPQTGRRGSWERRRGPRCEAGPCRDVSGRQPVRCERRRERDGDVLDAERRRNTWDGGAGRRRQRAG
ncbi:MAG: hypothetical protein ACPIOQ_23995, partial [Promethearchaeia archaeon]